MSQIRITAGSLRGRKIPVPEGPVRPTSSKARQAYFDIMQARIAGADFLELFAGSGIFSFEAVSRGAGSAFAVDRSRRAIDEVRRLAEQWKLAITGIAADIPAGLGRIPSGRAFDLVYADPPYDSIEIYRRLLPAIERHVRLAEGATVAIEHRSGSMPFDPEGCGFRLIRTARYGDIAISLIERGDRNGEQNEPDVQ